MADPKHLGARSLSIANHRDSSTSPVPTLRMTDVNAVRTRSSSSGPGNVAQATYCHES